MLKNIYIMDENGVLLYSKDFEKQKYDENILIGFFTSLANFSREALGTAVKNVDIGEENKLILVPIQEERILGAVIVNVRDNSQLVSQILKNILQEFVDSYSPEYNVERIFHEDMEKIINNNLSEKILRSPVVRFILSWLIVAPMSYGLIVASIFTTTFLYALFDLERFTVNSFLFFSRFLPSLIAISTVDMIILFLLPNLILGYLSPSWKIGIVSSVIQLGLTIYLFFNSMEPLFTYIIIGYLPLALIFSLFFLFIGTRMASRRFLKK
jgi:hypothetical protein